MNFQKIINILYRYPLSNWKTKQRFGGFFEYKKMLKNQVDMINSSYKLDNISSYQDGLPLYFLTGKSHIYQTIFCAHSLHISTKVKFQFILVDDGTFDEKLANRVKKQMPNVKLILKEEIQKNLESKLPKEKFPYLNYKRGIYPHIKKLTDIHTIDDNSNKLVLDSDMLFWNEPIEIIEWLRNPNGCIYMLDCEESYGYDRKLMESLCKTVVPDLVNVGVFGIKSSSIDWQQLENWTMTLESEQGASYFLEQALSAMLVVHQSKTVLNRETYLVNPTEIPEESKNSKLHHYVDLSKKVYFEKAWKKIINASS